MDQSGALHGKGMLQGEGAPSLGLGRPWVVRLSGQQGPGIGASKAETESVAGTPAGRPSGCRVRCGQDSVGTRPKGWAWGALLGASLCLSETVPEEPHVLVSEHSATSQVSQALHTPHPSRAPTALWRPLLSSLAGTKAEVPGGTQAGARPGPLPPLPARLPV